MTQGGLVPDSVVLGIVKERLMMEDCSKGFVLDGFPRTIPQANSLDLILSEAGKSIQVVVALDVPADDIVKRLSGRWSCPSCSKGYHIEYNPPVVCNKCDICSVDLIQRPDDMESTVRRRLEVYEEQTAPLKAFYESAGLLRTVDGTGEISDIQMRIKAVLKI